MCMHEVKKEVFCSVSFHIKRLMESPVLSWIVTRFCFRREQVV